MADNAEHRGAVLRARRREVGFASMAACAAASTELEALDPTHFKRFSRSSLNTWELDSDGESLEVAHGRAVRTLSYLLQWSGPDFSTYVGVPIGTVPRQPQRLQGALSAPYNGAGPHLGGVRVSIQLAAAPQTSGWSLEPELAPGSTVIAEPGDCPPGGLAVMRLPDRRLIVCRLANDGSRQPALFEEGRSADAATLARDAELVARVVQVRPAPGPPERRERS